MSGTIYPQLQTCPCQTCPSTIFIFESVQWQNAANTVYEHQQAYNIRKNAAITGKTYKFKSDYERMQALLGKFGRDPVCPSSSQTQ
jgi:hypothetical protein